MITCPRCSSLSTIPIIYGKPSIELERAASRGLVELAGCIVESGNPTMRCLECHHAWWRADNNVSDMTSTDQLSRIKQIVERYLFPIHAGMVSAELFDDSWQPDANSFEAIYAYIQLKETLGIQHGCTLEQVASVQSFKKTNRSFYNQVINELKRQVCLLSLSGNGFGGLHHNLFLACALVFNASPMAHGTQDQNQLNDFLRTIRQGHIGFE